ncbi:reverse transcriptase domain-containing protein [Tanacetum coccineum]
MQDDYKLIIQPQRRLNPKLQDVVKNEVVKLLDFGLIYPILDSSILPNSDRTRRSRKDNIHLSLWDFCLPTNVVWIMKRTNYFPKMHDANLYRMLARCEETNLVLNWEKCHFMVKEGIVLGHKISRAGIVVDRAKIDVIAKFPYPTNVKGVRSFLGHAGFYRRFIKDFSMISKPMTQLLMKDAKFNFFDDCKKAFNILKEKLTTAPIIISPNWNVPFKLMCDVSDFAVGAVLGQQIDEKFEPIYYDRKTLNNGQEHYTTTEKELLAVVFSFDNFRAENLAVDHMSGLENLDLGAFTEEEITDKFPDEHLMILKTELNNDEPWLCGDKNFKVGDKVLLFNSRFNMHSGKLKSRWYGSNVVKTVYPYGNVEITDKNIINFKVNGQRLKKYHDGHIDTEDKEVVEFAEDTISHGKRNLKAQIKLRFKPTAVALASVVYVIRSMALCSIGGVYVVRSMALCSIGGVLRAGSAESGDSCGGKVKPSMMPSMSLFRPFTSLSKRKFVIVCYEKVVRIPLKGDEIFRVHGERTLGAAKALMNAKIEMDDLPRGLGMTRDFRYSYIMRSCVINFGGSYYLSIWCAPFEALYGKKCRSLVLWAEIRESSLTGLELVQETIDKVVLVKEKPKMERYRQKSYVDYRRNPLEFEVGDHVLLKVMPWKGVVHFGKKGKLALRYVGPFEILERIGLVAYRLRLPEELNSIHDTFCDNRDLSSSLIPLSLGNFDVIVGMDWLSNRKFGIVCHEKVVRIPLEGDEILWVHGERTQGVVKTLMNTKVDEPKLSDISVIRDFIDVFPEDLSMTTTTTSLLNDLTRDDLKELYRLMMLKCGDNMPKEEFERVLWGDLKTMFDPPSTKDAVWNLTHQQKVLSWRYFHSCVVHCLTLEAAHIYMLTEVKYPLPSRVCQAMLEKKLLGDRKDESTMSNRHKDWLVQEQTALGKDFSNPFMADNLPKIVWLSTHHIYVCKELASPQGYGLCLGVKEMIVAAQSEAFKQENVLAERLHGLDQHMERKEDGSLYFMDRIWVPLVGDVRMVILNEAHKSRYFVHLRADDILYSIILSLKVLLYSESPHFIFTLLEKWQFCSSIGKLALRYVGPFEILKRIGLVAYRLRLPEELNSVHDTFHVLNLKKCLADANLHVPLDEIKVDKILCFVEEPVEIMD